MTHAGFPSRANRRARLALLGLTTILSSGLALPAFAQSAPPQFVDVDQNGVDLVSGTFVASVTEGEIGSGEGSVSLVRSRNGGLNWTDNWTGGLLFQTSGATTTAYALFGSASDAFTSTGGGGFTSAKANGATLVANTVGTLTGYLYTASDGTKIQFRSNGAGTMASAWPVEGFACAGYSNTACNIPVSITKPNGMTYTLNWTYVVKCTSGSGPTCVGGKAYYRFGGVTSSAGYGFSINYVSDIAGNFSVPQTDWYKKTSVVFSNANNTPASAPTITYSTPGSGYPDFTDPAGRTWAFTGGNNSAVTAVQRPAASSATTTITYSGSPAYVSSMTVDGITTTYSRSVSGSTATTTITDAQSNQTIVVADLSKGRVTQVTKVLSPSNLVTSYTYDSNSRLTETTYPEGNKVQYAYDARGNITTTTLKAKPAIGGTDIVTTAGYDSTCSNVVTCNSPNWTKDALLNQTDFTYDSTTGQVATVTAPAASSGGTRPQTRYTYTSTSGVSLLTGVSTCQVNASCSGTADEVKTTIGYDSNLLPTTMSQGAGDGSLTATRTATYDSSGNLLTVDGPLAGTDDTTTYRYNAANELVGTISADPDGSGALKRRAAKTTYNADGQATVSEIGTVNGTTDTDWAAFSSTQQTTSTYDTNGFKTKDVLTASGTTYQVMQYSYDTVGRPECTALRMNSATWGSLPSSACSLGTAGSYGNDQITKTIYDAAGRTSKVQTGFGVSGVQADEVITTYNGNDTPDTVTDAEGNKTTYAYDGFDRLTKTSYPSTTKGAGTSSSTDYEELVYNAASQVTSQRLRGYASDSSKHVDYSYDNLGRPITKDLPGSEPDVTYSYDLLNRLTGASQSGNALSFSFDALSRNTSQAGPLGTVSYQYDAAGQRTRMTWPDTFYVDYDYLVTGEVLAIRENGATSGAGVLVSFTYDDLGRRTGMMRGNGASSSYAFDNISRLSSIGQDLSGTGSDVTTSFTYSPANQIASQTRNNDAYAWNGHYNVNRAYTSNGLNQLATAGSTSLSYDARGNLSSAVAGSTTDSYSYSSENLLTAATVNSPSGPVSTTLSYDPATRLYQTASSTTRRFLYDGANIVAEYDGTGAVVRRYVHGAGMNEPLVQYLGSGTSSRYWLHADERGSIIARGDNSGSTMIVSYDEYGIPSSTGLRFQYTGQAWIPEVGLNYYKARMYSPTLGRFMQSDPIGFDGGMNMYAYVRNDGVNATDPWGLKDCVEGDTSPECQIVVQGGVKKRVRVPVVNVVAGPVSGPVEGRGPNKKKACEFGNAAVDLADKFGKAALITTEFGTVIVVAGGLKGKGGAPAIELGGTVMAAGAVMGNISAGFQIVGGAAQGYGTGDYRNALGGVGNIILNTVTGRIMNSLFKNYGTTWARQAGAARGKRAADMVGMAQNLVAILQPTQVKCPAR